MDEIRELLQRLSQLNDEELANLRELVKTHASEINDDEATDEQTSVLVELGEVTDAIVAETQAREIKAQEAQEARQAAREKIKAIGGEAEAEAGEEEAPEEPEAEEPEAEAEVEAEEPASEEAPAEQVPVAASGAVQRMARTLPKPKPSPEQAPEGPITGQLVASAGHMRGRPITDRMDLARELGEEAERQVSANTLRQKVIVATAKLEYPPERKLTGDADHNTQIIDAVCSPGAPRVDKNTGALVATGGICSPVNVDYAVPTWVTADRPIRDGLPGFEATRGGVLYVEPPDLAEWEGATSIWSEATDASPGAETKAIKTLSCGSEVKVYVEAIPTRIGFGNMQARFAPEQVAANTEVAMAAAARVAEENLLNLIEEKSVKKLETAQHLGAARDLFSNIAFAVAAYRNIHRIPESQSFTILLPILAKELIRADLAREQAHDNSGSFNVWTVSDDMIEALFRTYGINVIWHLDGQKEPSSKNYESQYAVATHVAEGKKIDEIYPAAAFEGKGLVWYLFVEGAIQFLDGGRLDLGVVRDSVLDATNDYELFVEPFEGIANRAFSKGVWQVLSTVKATGGSAATVTAVAP